MMNLLTQSLLALSAQATSPATPAPGDAPADPAAPPTPAQPDAAALEEARRVADEAAKAAAGQEELGLLFVWEKLNEVERGVVIILMIATLYTVYLMIVKIVEMRRAATQTKAFLAAFRKANSVEEAEAIVRKLPTSGIKTMFDAGMAEVKKTQDLGLYTMRDARDHTMQRVNAAMTIKQNEHLEELGSSMTFLASIGSNAPFIGLFGTVWGIMVAFIGIAASQTTSLAVVAPGIAGALLATAAGLAAAIPAVLLYNFAAKQIAKQGGRLEDFSAEFTALVSRDMDRRGV